MKRCPRCGGDAKRIPAGVSQRTGKPYGEFWICNDDMPCQDRWNDGSMHSLSWKSQRQWNYLHPSLTPRPQPGRVTLIG